MKDRIYEDYNNKKQELKLDYMKKTNVEFDESEFKSFIPNENYDLIRILSEFDLIKMNPSTLEAVNDFYEYIFKLGIEIGVREGQKRCIEEIKKNTLDLTKIMNTPPEEFVNFNIESDFIGE